MSPLSKSMDIDSELGLKMYFDRDHLGDIETINFNITLGIYESSSPKFHNQCQKYNFLAQDEIEMEDQYGKDIVISTKQFDSNIT